MPITDRNAHLAALALAVFCLLAPPGLAQTTDAPDLDRIDAAMKAGDVDALTRLLAEGTPKPPLPLPLLQRAVETGNLELVDVVLEAGAKIDAMSSGPQDGALGWGPEHGTTAVMLAAARGHREIVERLIARGADIAVIGAVGRTFTSSAIQSGLLPANAVLPREQRGSPDEKVSIDRLNVLLRKAAAAADLYQMQTLMALGASPYTRDENGRNALLYFVANSRTYPSGRYSLDVLKELGPSLPNAWDKDGNGALGIAILTNAPGEVIQYFTEDPSFESHWRNGAGESCWDLAERAGGTALAFLPERPFSMWSPPEVKFPEIPPITIRLHERMTDQDWRQAQRELRRLGLYSGSIDGEVGPATKRGLAAYFRVTLDEIYGVASATCDAAWLNFEEIERHFDPGDSIEFHEANLYYLSPGRIAVIDDPEGEELVCSEHKPRDGVWDIISIQDGSYTINLEKFYCSKNSNVRDAVITPINREDIVLAGSQKCRGRMFGAPVSGGRWTSWTDY